MSAVVLSATQTTSDAFLAALIEELLRFGDETHGGAVRVSRHEAGLLIENGCCASVVIFSSKTSTDEKFKHDAIIVLVDGTDASNFITDLVERPGFPNVRFLVQLDAMVSPLVPAEAACQGFEVTNLNKLASTLCAMRWSSTCNRPTPGISPTASPCSMLRTSVPDLRSVTTLDLSNSNLTSFPTALFSVSETLSFLNLGGNRISDLPLTMGSFTRLHTLFFAGNAFTTVPEVLGSLPALTMLSFKSNSVVSVPATSLAPSLNWLILTDNAISELPATIGACIGMRKLMLANNRLSSLPHTMAALKSLELLRLAANRFVSLPAWLFSLPRLSWLAIAGNPCCEQRSTTASTSSRIIPWSALRVGHVLGSGASGVVHAVEVVDETLDVPAAGIALKLFKGEATSDGLPADEMAAAVRVGMHPNTIQVLGVVEGGPSPGLLLPRIPPHYTSLGGPPSFQSITRDTYPRETTFNEATALSILTGIASVCAHLHGLGICHGDVYAHNILIDRSGSGHVLLVDFGAASFYAGTGMPMQALEVRAFGCLVDDVLTHLEPSCDATIKSVCASIRDQCWRRTPGRRPTFAALWQQLSVLGEARPAARRAHAILLASLLVALSAWVRK